MIKPLFCVFLNLNLIKCFLCLFGCLCCSYVAILKCGRHSSLQLPDLSKSESICVLNEGTLSAGCWVNKTTENYKTERLKGLVLAISDIFKRLNSFLADFCQLPSFLPVQFQSHIMPEQVVTATELNIEADLGTTRRKSESLQYK